MLLQATFRPPLDFFLTPVRPVFLQGCGLPAAWAGQSQWRVLETGFGLGLNFLATWLAWKNDPQRPRLLHFVSTEACPVSAADLFSKAADHPDLLPLAVQLCAQWHGLLPGLHRLAFERSQVLLTICIGDAKALLKEQSFEADTVFLSDVNSPDQARIFDPHLLKAIARCCRRGSRLAGSTATRGLTDGLTQSGFKIRQTLDLEAQPDADPAHLQAVFNPPWEPKKAAEPYQPKPRSPARCIVIGAGLAGAACAASLARRGWQVTVLDTNTGAASGASALPVGLLAPHMSPDDSLLSRMSRHGLRATWQVAKSQLLAGVDWQASGVLQRRFDASGGLPMHWPEAGEHWSRWAGFEELHALETATGSVAQSALNPETPALWHAAGGWIKPKRLVEALLATPGIRARYSVNVAGLTYTSRASQDGCWQVLDADQNCIAEAELVVLAAGFESAGLTNTGANLPLQAIRGQVAWGPVTDASVMPPFPVNGHGSFVPAFPGDDENKHWLMGATFQRGNNSTSVNAADQTAIYGRLQQLLPRTAEALKTSFDAGQTPQIQAWAGVRCVSPDRLPLVGPLNDAAQPGLYACTALGSRGLSFAVLCGELLAAWLHAEPLPIEKRLARSLLASRHHFTE